MGEQSQTGAEVEKVRGPASVPSAIDTSLPPRWGSYLEKLLIILGVAAMWLGVGIGTALFLGPPPRDSRLFWLVVFAGPITWVLGEGLGEGIRWLWRATFIDSRPLRDLWQVMLIVVPLAVAVYLAARALQV